MKNRIRLPKTWTALLAGLLAFSSGSHWANAQGVSFDWAVNTAYLYEVGAEVDDQGNTILAFPRNGPGSDGQLHSWSLFQKLSAEGTPLWSRTNALPFLYEITKDPAGEIYAAGGALRWTDGADVLATTGMPTEGTGGVYIAKMAADGTVQWVRRFGPDIPVYLVQVCFDSAGNYYVLWAGRPDMPDGGEITIAKYDPTGQQMWSRQGSISNYPLSSEVAATPDGGLLIAGTFLLKLDSNGNLLWAAQQPEGDRISSLASDKLGNAYIAYELSDYNPGLAKYSPSGERLWARQGIDLGIGGFSIPPKLAPDDAGNCYFTGTFWKSDIGKMQFGDIVLSTGARAEMFLVKYSTNGDLLWATQSRGMEADDGDGGRFSDTRVSAIVRGPSGGFVVTGTIAGWVRFGNKHLIGPGPHSQEKFVVQFSDAPPPPPVLQVARSNQELVLSWPATAVGFRVQAAETLSAATTWNPLSTVPVLAGDRYTVSVPVEEAPRFFRLVKP